MDQDLTTTTTASIPPPSPSPHLFTTPSDLLPDLPSLLSLARRGQYKSLLDAIASLRRVPNLLPHHHLSLLSLSLLSLSKLRRFSDAASELDSLQSPFDSPEYLFQSHPHIYGPHLTGSMLPFALRFLHADLPQRLGNRHVTLDRLYFLLSFTQIKLNNHNITPHGNSNNNNNNESSPVNLLPNLNSIESQSDNNDASSSPHLNSTKSELNNDNDGSCLDVSLDTSPDNSVSLDTWRRREAFVMAALIRNHFAHREFDVTLALLRQLLERNPADPILLSRLGYVQLQIGDISGAAATFSIVAKSIDEENVELGNLVRRNRALERIVEKDYAAAVREYEECIERDPEDVVALNNKALCLLYSRDLSDSIKVLEGALERVPTVAVNETVVMNLCSMYELAYVNHGEVKKSLGKWIAAVAPDDFDPSCTRI